MRKTPIVAVDDLEPKTLKPKTSGMTFSTSRAGASPAVGREPAVKLGKTAAGPEFSALAQASILIVDDEPGMRNFLVRTLAPRCKLVDEAADTDQASRKLDSNRYDVVILDNIMPGKNGVDWLAEQRAVGFFADAILITAYADLL
jgi:PleD family two-component response regulator